MKNPILLLIGSAALALTSCVYDSGPSHPFRDGRRPNYGPSRPHQGSHSDAKFYREGRSQGQADARRGNRDDASRHMSRIPRQARDEFRRGYARGYQETAVHRPRDPRRNDR